MAYHYVSTDSRPRGPLTSLMVIFQKSPGLNAIIGARFVCANLWAAIKMLRRTIRGDHLNPTTTATFGISPIREHTQKTPTNGRRVMPPAEVT
jgi:hypothetical protein